MSDTSSSPIARLAEQFIAALPHGRAQGLRILDVGEGHATLEMPYDDKLIGNPETGVIHGGAVSALMDTAGGTAVMSRPEGRGGTATISLRIDYMRAANPGQAVVARAECYHATRSVAFVRATAFDDDKDNPVATATGTFTLAGGGQ